MKLPRTSLIIIYGPRVIRPSPVYGVKAFRRAQYDLSRPPSTVIAKLTERYPGRLARPVIDVFYCVVTSRR